MKINETIKYFTPYTKEEIEKTLEVILNWKGHNIIDIPEWLLPSLNKELKRQFKDKPVLYNVN